MRNLLILYHSSTTGTQQMVDACARGAAAEPSVEVAVKHASEVKSADVLHAHGYIFATPEYLGGMSGLVKDFFDRTYYDVLEHIQARPYGIMVCAGSDGQGAVTQIQRIATGWRLKQVAPAVITNVRAQTSAQILATKTLSADQLAPCSTLGQLMATGLALSVF